MNKVLTSFELLVVALIAVVLSLVFKNFDSVVVSSAFAILGFICACFSLTTLIFGKK